MRLVAANIQPLVTHHGKRVCCLQLIMGAGRERPGGVGRTVNRNLKGSHEGWWEGDGLGGEGQSERY